MKIRALHTLEEYAAYVNFAGQVYDGDPSWIPPNTQSMINILCGELLSGERSRMQSFWAEEQDSVVAVVTAVIEDEFNRRWNERMGHLFFFEALPGHPDSVSALLEHASQWLGINRMEAVRFACLPGWQLPLTIDAYHEPATMFHTYNPASYHRYLKDAGFYTERGATQYQVQLTREIQRKYRGFIQDVDNKGVKLRPFDFGRLDEDARLLTRLYNETFVDHWGFMAMAEAQEERLREGLRAMLLPDMTVFAEVDGEAAGFVYSLPDLNQALALMGGRPVDDNVAEFLQYMRAIDHGVLLIVGVRKKFRNRGIGTAMAARSYLAMMARGYTRASYTIVLDDNWSSRRTAEKLGCRAFRNFVVYRKDLSAQGQG